MTPDEKKDLIIRASWLSHVEGLTQAEVGERLGVTRRSVNEMLREATETGLVRVTFNSSAAECVELEQALREAFGLKDAVVALSPEDEQLIPAVLGRATADYLGRFIARERPTSIGVGWGTTLHQTIRFSRQQSFPDLTIRSLMGGLTHGASINTFETVRSFANIFGAKCEYFVAPIYADSPESRDIILEQPVFRDIFERSSDVGIAIAGVGDLTNQSLQIRYGISSSEVVKELHDAGAVGDLIGHYVDASGHEVDHPVNKRVFAPDLAAFRAIPSRIICAGGPYKHAIMSAIGLSGHATVVITDTDCARAMLDAAAAEPK